MPSPYSIFGNAPRQGNLYGSGSLRPYGSSGGTASSNSPYGAISFSPASRAVGLLEQPQASATIKSGAIADRIGQGFQSYDQSKTADTASLADFTKQYTASNPAAKTNTAQESGAIGGFYDGGVQAHLDQLANQSLAAGNAAAARAIGQAGRASSIYRMQNGDSSYADRMMGDQFSNIAVQNAVRDAQQRQQNYQTVLSGQQGNLGVRNKLNDAYLQRMLVPGQTANDLLTRQLSSLGNLGSLDYANTMYGAPTTPQYQAPAYQPPNPNNAVKLAMDNWTASHPNGPIQLGRPAPTPLPNVPYHDVYPQPYPGQPFNTTPGPNFGQPLPVFVPPAPVRGAPTPYSPYGPYRG